MGSPQKKYKIIHLAGSKGKGSTAVFCSRLLESAGQRVGLYSSPHVMDYRERFQCFPESDASEDRLFDQAKAIDRMLETLTPGTLPGGDVPTTFEILTLLGFLYFASLSCQWVVLETGLGGRLDATNVVDPRAVILTPIELEHCDFLGGTLEAIAREKAGIIKEGTTVLCAPQKEDVKKLFQLNCIEKGADFVYLPDYLKSVKASVTDGGNRISLDWSYKSNENYLLSMLGDHQAWNAALALLTFDRLRKMNEISSPLKHQNKFEALIAANLAGRGQLISGAPKILLDGAHTAASLTTISECSEQLSGDKRMLLFGCAIDKDSLSMARHLKGKWDRIIITTPGTFKVSDPTAVAQEFRQEGWPVHLELETEKAWELAIQKAGNDGLIVVAGSFYLVGLVSEYLADQASSL